jgi:hypothetical protein
MNLRAAKKFRAILSPAPALNTILVEVRAAQELPWGRASLYRTIFPQMTLWAARRGSRAIAL